MAEAFVKGFTRDYVHVSRLETAESVLAQLPGWMLDYSTVHPHRGLGMRSPREYRQLELAGAPQCPTGDCSLMTFPTAPTRLRAIARAAASSSETQVVRRAIQVLAVVGEGEDLALLEGLVADLPPARRVSLLQREAGARDGIAPQVAFLARPPRRRALDCDEDGSFSRTVAAEVPASRAG